MTMSKGLFALLRVLSAAAFSVLLPQAGSAGPYDAHELKPGDLLRNEISLTWTGASEAIRVSDQLVIGGFDHPVELEFLQPAAAGELLAIAPAEYSLDGGASFVAAPEAQYEDGRPVDLGAGPFTLSQTSIIRPQNPVFLRVAAPASNIDSRAEDLIEITLTDSATGDIEYVRLTETSADSGLFTGVFSTSAEAPAKADGIVSTRGPSQIIARYSDPWRSGKIVRAGLMVGPFSSTGRLFDSRSGQMIEDIEVSLVDAQSGRPAQVFGADLKSPYPSTLRTGAAVQDAAGIWYEMGPGEYLFPHVPPGHYRLELALPPGLTAPSLAPEADLQVLPGAPYHLGPASWLSNFTVAPGISLHADIPVDGEGFLTVTREGSSDTLETGDFIKYSVTVQTNLVQDVIGELVDNLAPGLRLIPSSLRINDQPARAPVTVDVASERLRIGTLTLPASGAATISYIASVTPQAVPGSILTTSSRASGPRLLSNIASHDLSVVDGLASSDDILLGRVVADGCSNQPSETDLSGIRLLLEDGTFAVTDARGRFSFQSLAKGEHVVAIDPLSVPRGWMPVLCKEDTRRSGSPLSQFVSSKGGYARQMAFHLKRARILDHPDPIPPVLIESSTFDAEWLAQNTHQQGVVFPPEGYLPRGKSIDVLAIRRSDQRFLLQVNGREVSALSRRPTIPSSDDVHRLDLWKGISLESGRNDIVLETYASGGDKISTEKRSVFFNETAARIEVIKDASILESDGYTRPSLVLKIANNDGVPLHPGTLVNLSVAPPHMISRIAKTGEGTIEQTSSSETFRVDADGLVRMRLAAPDRPSDVWVQVFTPDGQSETHVPIALKGAPWVVSGLATGTAAAEHLSRHVTSGTDTQIADIAGIRVSGRGAVYARGVLDGSWLATLRYDSSRHGLDSDFTEALSTAPRLEAADRSIEGDAAQSRSPLFLKLEGHGAELLYGDFDTALTAGRANYTRRLTGARVDAALADTKITGFISESPQKYMKDVFAADGTSGPFRLSSRHVIANSEVVAVEVTDRSDPGALPQRIVLRRGQDYDIDYSEGRIFLSVPLSSRDPAMNPQSLAVEYEVEDAPRDGIIVGGRLETSRGLGTYGMTAIHEDHAAGSDGAGTLLGLDASLAIGEETTASVAIAASAQNRSNTLVDGADGHSAELRIEHADQTREASAWLRSQTTGFGIENQSTIDEQVLSGGLSGSLLIGPEDEAGIGPRTALEAETQVETNLATQDIAATSEIALSRTTEAGLIKAGLRGLTKKTGLDEGSRLKAVALHEAERFEGRLRYSLGLEHGLAEIGQIQDSDNAILSAEWDMTDRLMLSMTSEVAFAGRSRAAVVGLNAAFEAWDGATISLGVLDAMTSAGSHYVGKAGITQQLEVAPGRRLSFSLDRQGQLSAPSQDLGPIREAGLSNPLLTEAYVSGRLGLSAHDALWDHSASLEMRRGEVFKQDWFSAESLRDISDDLGLEISASLRRREGQDGDYEVDYEIGTSLAWRPAAEDFLLLDRLALRHDASPGAAESRLVNTLYYSRDMATGHEINLRQGTKISDFDFGGQSETDLITLVGAEYRYDLTSWLDLGVQTSMSHSMVSRSTSHSSGASLGFTPFKNGWVSLGYNFTGFQDRDFEDSGFTAQGPFVQFRLKLDGHRPAR